MEQEFVLFSWVAIILEETEDQTKKKTNKDEDEMLTEERERKMGPERRERLMESVG